MSEQVPVETKLTKHDAIKAIESLQKRGSDLNPYSLADELQVPHSTIVTSADIMEVLSLARGEVNGVVAAEYERLLQRVEELERKNSALQRHSEEGGGGSEQIERLQTENQLLNDSKNSLSEQVQELKDSNRTLQNRLSELENELAEVKRSDEDGEEGYDGEEPRRKKKNKKGRDTRNLGLSEEATRAKALSEARDEFQAREKELQATIERLEQEVLGASRSSAPDLSEDINSKLTELQTREAELSTLVAESEERERQLTRILASMEAREQSLVAESDELTTQIRKLKEEVKALSAAQQVLALSVQDSYQQGFDAAKREFVTAAHHAADTSYGASAAGMAQAQHSSPSQAHIDYHQAESIAPDAQSVQEMSEFLMGSSIVLSHKQAGHDTTGLSDQGFDPNNAVTDPLSAHGLSLEEHPLNSGLLDDGSQYEQQDQYAQQNLYTHEGQYAQQDQYAQQEHDATQDPYAQDHQYAHQDHYSAPSDQYAQEDQYAQQQEHYAQDHYAQDQYAHQQEQYAHQAQHAQQEQSDEQQDQYAQRHAAEQTHELQYTQDDLYAQAENYDPYGKVDPNAQSAHYAEPEPYAPGYAAQGFETSEQYAPGFGPADQQAAEPAVTGAFGDASAVSDSAATDYTLPDYMNDGLFSESSDESSTAPLDEADDESEPEEEKAPAFDPDELRGLLNKKTQHNKTQEINLGGTSDADAKSGLKKFVGGKHATQGQEQAPAGPRTVPPDIRKACMLLGIKPEDLNRQHVFDAWKREMSKPGVHPDTGGDTEMAMYLNNAKDTLVRYLDAQAPKLGKVFGASHKDGKDNQKGDNR